jgi:hypothetical protein
MPELEEERLITLIANFDPASPRDDATETGLQDYQFGNTAVRISYSRNTVNHVFPGAIRKGVENLVTSKKFPLISNLCSLLPPALPLQRLDLSDPNDTDNEDNDLEPAIELNEYAIYERVKERQEISLCLKLPQGVG